MRKLILQEWVTVNGFAAGPAGEIDFFTAPELSNGVDDDLLHFIDTLDLILLGAATYRMFADYWPEATTDKEPVADKLNAMPKIVFSKSLHHAPWGKWEDARVVKGNAADEVKRLKQEPGKDMVVWGSISLAQSLIKAGVIDEYQFWVCPTVLGSGKLVFPDDPATLNMTLIETKQYASGLVFLRYAPDGK